MKILFCACLLWCCFETYRTQKLTDREGARYLLRYGYIDTFDEPEKIVEGLKRLQHFANLRVTGEFDEATVKQMQVPRCGLQDPQIKVTRSRRYTHQGTTWAKSQLTWRLEGRGRTLDQETVRRILKKAFAYWNAVTNLDFIETANAEEPDIWVKFARYSHDDPYPFDGQGGTLAHAFYPHNNEGLSGDVHFDDDEDYTAESAEGRNLLWVATHEIGHSIGLEHSSVREAVMYPWYTTYKPGFTLHYDDIVGIQTLYGSKKNPAEVTTTTTTTTPTTTTSTTTTTKASTTTTTKASTTTTTKALTKPTTTTSTTTTTTTLTKPTTATPTITKARPCPVGRIGTVYYENTIKYNILLTEEDKLYFVNKEGGIRYGPITTSNYIPKYRTPNQIDAAFTTKLNERNVTVFFSGESYYIYQYFRYQSGPHSIYGNKQGDTNPLRLQFPTWVSKIDAAMTWYRNKRTYFFAGESYWRYNSEIREFDQGYPRITQSAWRGVPKIIDAAYSSDELKTTFFISGDQYYKLDDTYVRVSNNYPVHIGEWLKCGEKFDVSRQSAIGLVKAVKRFGDNSNPAAEP